MTQFPLLSEEIVIPSLSIGISLISNSSCFPRKHISTQDLSFEYNLILCSVISPDIPEQSDFSFAKIHGTSHPLAPMDRETKVGFSKNNSNFLSFEKDIHPNEKFSSEKKKIIFFNYIILNSNVILPFFQKRYLIFLFFTFKIRYFPISSNLLIILQLCFYRNACNT